MRDESGSEYAADPFAHQVFDALLSLLKYVFANGHIGIYQYF